MRLQRTQLHRSHELGTSRYGEGKQWYQYYIMRLSRDGVLCYVEVSL